MKHSVIRIAGLQTQYLHRLPDGSFEWSPTKEGRHEFANPETAGIEAKLHEGIAVPIDPTPEPEEAPIRPHPAHPPRLPADKAPARDWLSRWEIEHDQ